MNQAEPWEMIVARYRKLVEQKHPGQRESWPIISGYNVKAAEFHGWHIFALQSTGTNVMRNSSVAGDLGSSAIGADTINDGNREAVRFRLEKRFGLKERDGLVLIDPSGWLPDSELLTLLLKHEYAMGMAPTKIFLSHKGADKALVRDFEKTLRAAGLDPWLDEDAMAAGVELERAILQGFVDSCAVVFFVTQNYVDENFLATEVNYALAEKRKKGDKFAIITLAFDGAGESNISALLHTYVWKTPSTHLEALREIIKAIPIKVGDPHWKL